MKTYVLKDNRARYDLEGRTLEFGKEMVRFCKSLKRDIVNRRLSDQVIRSGTSLGANYREANETETKKDFLYRIRICRKEAKETIYWLKLLLEANPARESDIKVLLKESTELLKIFAAIHEKSK